MLLQGRHLGYRLLAMVTIKGNGKGYFHHGREADLPPLLPFVMGARGPDVVGREGRLAGKRGRTGISNLRAWDLL